MAQIMESYGRHPDVPQQDLKMLADEVRFYQFAGDIGTNIVAFDVIVGLQPFILCLLAAPFL